MKRTLHLSLFAAILFWIAWQPTTAQPVQNGYAAVTCYSDNTGTGFVVGLMDVRLANSQPVNMNWAPPMWHGPAASPWNRNNLGEVFGIAFDPSGNIYVAATTAYNGAAPGGPAGSGAIYQLGAISGSITPFVSTLNAASGSVIGTSTIPNTGNGLGNIAWDVAHNQLFATNIEDGKIYRINSAGIVQSVYDPFTADGMTSGPAPLGERLWGIGVYRNRVYFSRWNEDCGNPSNVSANEIWSILIDATTGNFSGVPQLEITVPTLPSSIHSNPVSDIAFSTSGNMLLAERTMNAVGNNPLYPNAHAARVLEYSFSGTWTLTANTFSIGTPGLNSGCGAYPTIGSSAAGGVDYAYASYDRNKNEIVGCDESVWASGDALQFYNPNVIYGFQRLPATGGDVTTSQLVDADGNLSTQDKTQIGDIEVYKRCLPDSTPCDKLRVRVDTTDDCCYSLSISGYSSGELTNVIANMLTSGVVFTGAIGPTGWNVTNSGSQVTWDSAGFIPGTSATGLRFCIQSSVSPPQQIEIVYHRKDGTECRDTITVYCDSVEYTPCVTFGDQQIRCKEQGATGWSYGISFTVTNYSPFSQAPWFLPAENVAVYSGTAGVFVAPGAVALSPTLGYGSTSGALNFTLSGPGLQVGQQVCIIVQLHGRKFKNDYQWCCPPDTICFIVPNCGDCCDSVDISISHNGGKQVGNTAATISSGTVTVGPAPVTKVQANIMSVSRSRIWCPDPSTGVYAPVSSATSIGALITGGTINPAMPVSSGFSPATSEVVWGTVYSGVNMTGGSVSLNLSFPGTSLGWRCRDTLKVCVRYTFTDTACRTCDTVVYYTVARCGRVDIVDHSDPVDLNPRSYGEVIQGEGISVGEPLYSDVVEGPGLALRLSRVTAGTLSVAHWWQDAVVGIDKVRIVRMHVIPEPGIDITAMSPVNGSDRATIADRTATIAMDLREGETDDFNLTFNNPTDARFFALRIRFDVVDMDDPETEMASRQYVVYGDLNGDATTGRISVDESAQSTPTLYKLLIGSNGENAAGWIAPACFRFTPPAGVRILASGPMPDSNFAEFHVLKSMSKASSMLLQLPSPGEFRKEEIAHEQSVALWLVLEGGANLFDLDWEALNMNGEIIGSGDVQLSPTSTVRDGDEYVPGASINLLETYPNPTQDRVTTRFSLPQMEKVTVGLYDLSGHEISRVVDNEQLPAGSHEYELNLKSVASGAYYIRLTTSKGTQTRSVVKQ